MPIFGNRDFGMDRRILATISGWLVAGFTFVFAAIANALLNLHSTPPLMEGLIYELIAFGLVGVLFIAIGLRAYVRASRGS